VEIHASAAGARKIHPGDEANEPKKGVGKEYEHKDRQFKQRGSLGNGTEFELHLSVIGASCGCQNVRKRKMRDKYARRCYVRLYYVPRPKYRHSSLHTHIGNGISTAGYLGLLGRFSKGSSGMGSLWAHGFYLRVISCNGSSRCSGSLLRCAPLFL
jgi:hypothetical protein